MKNCTLPLIALCLAAAVLFSCKKNETTSAENDFTTTASAVPMISDSISSAASQEIEGRKFVKKAAVNMEVKDVYESSIFIEKKLQELGGFVTSSNLNAKVISEKTYQTSDEYAVLVRKFQTENSMQIRVPSENLGALLTFINDKKIFLKSRTILAEDVTNNAKISELENSRQIENQAVIRKMKNDKDKVSLLDQNLNNKNAQEVNDITLADDLKYSSVSVYIQDPSVKTAEIAVVNAKGVDQKYQLNFLYDLKIAVQDGFYLVQKFAIGLITVWPFLIIAGIALYFLRWRKNKTAPEKL